MLDNNVNEQGAPTEVDVQVLLRRQQLATRHWRAMALGLAVALGAVLVVAGVVGCLFFSQARETKEALELVMTDVVTLNQSRRDTEAQLHVVEQYLEKITVAEIAKLGGKVKRDQRKLRNPVVGVIWSRSKVKDSDLLLLNRLKHLESLDLAGTAVTDKGLENLKDLGKLGMLYLEGTRITNAGLKALTSLPELRELNLDDTQVSDAGLATLQDVKKLTSLSLGGTAITDEAVEPLSRLAQLEFLDLMDVPITQLRGAASRFEEGQGFASTTGQVTPLLALRLGQLPKPERQRRWMTPPPASLRDAGLAA